MSHRVFLPVFLILALIYLIIPKTSHAQALLTENFDELPDGSDGSPKLSPGKGSWQVSGGQYLQNSNLYDCGSLLQRFIHQSFKFSVAFRHLDGEPGAGIFFSSHSSENTEYSHMARFDGVSRFMAGYFEHGEFQAQKIFRVDLDTTGWHVLELGVDLQKKTYSISLDGHEIGQPVELVYPTGYVGLQSSGGRVRFDNVELSIDPKEWNAPVYWPGAFSVDSRDRILLPDVFHNKLHILNEAGGVDASLGASVKDGGIFHRIGKAVSVSGGRLIVSDLATHTLHLFDTDNQWVQAIGGKGVFSDITDVVFLEAENLICLLESDSRRLHLIDNNLKITKTISLKLQEFPVAAYPEADGLAILDQAKREIVLVGLEDGKVVKRTHLPSGTARDFVVWGHSFIVVMNDKVIRLNEDGVLQAEFSAISMVQFQPGGIEKTRAGDLVIADRGGGRLIFTDSLLTDPVLTVHSQAQSSEFMWNTPFPETGQIRLRKKDGDSPIVRELSNGKDHSVSVVNQQSSSIYYASFYPTLKTIPSDSNWSKAETIITPDLYGFKPVLHYAALCIVFSNVMDEQQPAPILTKNELDRIKGQILDGVRFFWIHSQFNLWVDLEFIEVQRSYNRDELFESLWYYPPRRKIIEEVVNAANKNLDNYASVFFVAGLQEYQKEDGRWQLRGTGGAFTNGLSANGKYGLSWWEATHENHNAGNNWLFVHEFSHQIDELFNLSGYPDFWFNHFAPKLGNVAAFGEHFDGNAYLLKKIPKSWWFDLVRGDTVMVKDLDRDEIPDNDDRLPLDERRLKSSPQKVDTDFDGLTDLEEVLLSNWIFEGQGEALAGETKLPDLTSPDTDRDGKIDIDDPNPLLAFDESIPFGNARIDGALSEDEWPSMNTFNDPRLQAEIYSQWDSTFLYFAIRLDGAVDFKIQIDANQDGWFAGSDNWIIKSDPAETVTAQLFDAGDFSAWPAMRNDVKVNDIIKFSTSSQSAVYVVEIAIDARRLFGFTPRSGLGIDFNFGFLYPMDEFGNRKYLSLAEPNRFIHGFLKGQP